MCRPGFAGTNCQFSNSETCHGNGKAQQDGSCECDATGRLGELKALAAKAVDEGNVELTMELQEEIRMDREVNDALKAALSTAVAAKDEAEADRLRKKISSNFSEQTAYLGDRCGVSVASLCSGNGVAGPPGVNVNDGDKGKGKVEQRGEPQAQKYHSCYCDAGFIGDDCEIFVGACTIEDFCNDNASWAEIVRIEETVTAEGVAVIDEAAECAPPRAPCKTATVMTCQCTCDKWWSGHQCDVVIEPPADIKEAQEMIAQAEAQAQIVTAAATTAVATTVATSVATSVAAATTTAVAGGAAGGASAAATTAGASSLSLIHI